MSRARLRKRILRPLALVLLTAATILGWNLLTANFATVEEGRVFRSGQMHSWGLARTVRDHRIKTVLNLRGHHPDQSWYRDERDATLAGGATQIDIALSSCDWMSRTQLRTLVDVLQTCEKPVLIHCWRGAERTGLVSAFLTLLADGSTLDAAHAQFSLRYLFLRAGDGIVTIEHFEQYEAWLGRNGLTHSPTVFRRWVNDGFTPGLPGRESWPFDPYPLAVFTRPSLNGPQEQMIWDERGRPASMSARRDVEPAPVR